MGVYLSTPNTEKTSIDQTCEKFSYGASSMQGWRMSQEDAHNCLPDFDKDTALFAVYDGHGGAEVAQYCASYLPGFIKDLKSYKEERLAEALKEAYLGFDELLTTPTVIKELKVLAGVESDEEETPAKKRTEADLLRQEADMPIEDLLAQYETGEAAQPRTRILRKKVQVNSPVIKPKKLPFPEVGSKKEAINSSENANTNSELDESDKNLNENAEKVDKITNGHAENENNINLEKESKMSSSTSLQQDTISSSAGNSSSHSQSSKHLSDTDQCSSSSSSTNQKKESGSSDVGGISSTSPADQGSSTISSSDSTQEPASSASSSSKTEAVGGSSGSSSVSGSSGSSSTVGETGESPSAGGSSSQDKSKEDSDEDEDYNEEEDVDFSGSDDDEDEDVEFDSEEEHEDSGEEEEELDETDSFVADEPHTEEPGSDSGSTAVVTLIRNKQIVVANAGDSRCILSRNGKAVELSFDHKPEDDIERNRIHAAGGKVTEEGRVNGGLNMSRAIGDHFYKRNAAKSAKEQMITALPDIETATLQDDDEFLVLACDGIWNSMTNQEVIDFVSEKMREDKEEKRLSLICEQLFDRCLAPNTMGDGTGCDNMTCIIVTFNKISNNNKNKRPAEDTEETSDKRQKTEDLGT